MDTSGSLFGAADGGNDEYDWAALADLDTLLSSQPLSLDGLPSLTSGANASSLPPSAFQPAASNMQNFSSPVMSDLSSGPSPGAVNSLPASSAWFTFPKTEGNAAAGAGLLPTDDWGAWDDWTKYGWGDANNANNNQAGSTANKATKKNAAIANTNSNNARNTASLDPWQGLGGTGNQPLDSQTFDFTMPSQVSQVSPGSDSWMDNLPYPTPSSLSALSQLTPDTGVIDLSSPDSSAQFPFGTQQLSPGSGIMSPDSALLSNAAAALGLPAQGANSSTPGSDGGNSNNNKKRKPTTPSSDLEVQTATVSKKAHIQKRAQHSKVERRYRTNLNDKIMALRNVVPALRSSAGSGAEDSDEDGDGGGAGSGPKVKKGTVLDEARSYIIRLQGEKTKLAEENKVMRQQLELIRRAATVAAKQKHMPPGSGRQRLDLVRVVLAILAGMLTMESFHTDPQNGRGGLFAIPTWLLEPIVRSLQHTSIAPGVSSFNAMDMLCKALLVLGVVFYVIWPAVRSSTTPTAPPAKAPASASMGAASSSADPKSQRRDAFLTAIQSVWIPEGALPETAAIFANMAKIGLGSIGINWLVYHSVHSGRRRLGSTAHEAEAARVKAWDVAVEAQLLGGDSCAAVQEDTAQGEGVNIDGSSNALRRRLLLTYLASLTLPATAHRRMLMALHVRVLGMSCRKLFLGALIDGIFMKWLSRRHWARARAVEKRVSSKPGSQEQLPQHLHALVHLSADEALTEEVVQSIYDLARQVKAPVAAENTMNAIAEIVARDPSIQTPCDAVAASWAVATTKQLQVEFLEAADTEEPELKKTWAKSLDQSLAVAPKGSVVFAYSMALRAVLSDSDRRKNCSAALVVAWSTPGSWLLPAAGQECDEKATAFQADLSLALKTAMAIASLHADDSAKSIQALATHISAQSEFELLGFVALNRFLSIALRDHDITGKNREVLETVAGMVRLWTARDTAAMAGLSPEAKSNAAQLCVRVFEWIVGKDGSDEDEGYNTME